MSDADLRLERLERLTRLRDSGALSDEEFAVEKRRVLMGEAPSPAPARKVTVEPVQAEPEVYDDEPEPEPRRRFPFVKVIAGVAVASAVAAAAFINTTPSDVPGRSPVKTTKSSQSAEPSRDLAAPPVLKPVVDLSKPFSIEDASECRFAGEGERAFNALMPERDGPPQSPSRVSIAGRSLSVVASKDLDASNSDPNAGAYHATVRFPEGTVWRGLRLSRISRTVGYFPESDGFDEKTVAFLETAADVQAELRAAGLSAPIAPASTGDSCGGVTRQIKPLNGGAALVCGSGC